MKKYWFPVILLFLLIVSSCSSPDQPADQPADEAAAVDTESEIESSQADEEDSAESAPAPTEIPPTDAPVEAAAPQEIVHWEYPGNFKSSPLQKIYDCKTGAYFKDGQAYNLSEVCDQWERNYFERPLNEGLTELYPQLDIVEAEFGQDDNWYYTQILVYAELIDNLVLDGVYAIEIDLDLDARGDILITATAPGAFPADEWHSNGVQVWLDANDDVGGPQAVLVDPRYDGDGYEELIFDAGMGDDPDLAFVKVYSDQPGLLAFGFKRGLLGETESFEWWVWAMAVDLGAAKYDPVDFFPQDTLFAMDNTCGWIFGSYPRDLPNICDTISACSAAKPTRLSTRFTCTDYELSLVLRNWNRAH